MLANLRIRNCSTRFHTLEKINFTNNQKHMSHLNYTQDMLHTQILSNKNFLPNINRETLMKN